MKAKGEHTTRAILIDPENKTLTEIQITNDDAEHRAILQCEELHRGAP